jgi:hypothetical protein
MGGFMFSQYALDATPLLKEKAYRWPQLAAALIIHIEDAIALLANSWTLNGFACLHLPRMTFTPSGQRYNVGVCDTQISASQSRAVPSRVPQYV